MKNKAIIFDMGGVLIDLDLEACKEAFKKNLGFQGIDDIIDACHQKGIWGEMEEGKITADQFRQTILAGSFENAVPQDVDDAVGAILVGIMEYKVALLKRLAEDYDIYMLSNNNPIATAHARRIFAAAGIDMDKDFRKCYLSYQMKMLKPSQEFYKAVMEDIALPSENLLFIDDSQKNVDAAIAAGLPAVFYQPGTDMTALLADALGEPSLMAEGGLA